MTSLISPVNALEAERDKDAVWRKEVNANLAGSLPARPSACSTP